MPFKNILIKTKDFVLKVYEKTSDDNAFNLAAALAYYTMFSIVPMLYIIIKSLGIIFDQKEISSTIFKVLSDLVGAQGANALQETLANLVVNESGWFQNFIGIIILIFTATTIFTTIQNGLNYIFRVKPKPKIGALKFFKTRLLAFSIIIGISFTLVVSLVINALIAITTNYLMNSFPDIEFIINILNNYLLPFLISTLFFGIIFKSLPDAKLSWKDALIGATFTGVLLTLGRYTIGIYVASSNIASLYDAAGSIMILFIWLYYTALIFYIGAVFTVVYAEEFGNGVVPEKNTLRFIHKELKIADENEKVIANERNEKVIDN